MKNHTIMGMIKSTKKRIIFLSIFIIISIPLSIFSFGSYLLINAKHESEVIALKAKLKEQEGLKTSALGQVDNVIKIRDTYRAYTKEIVELLHNKDTYLGMGGPSVPIKDSDEAKLLQMKVIISSMNDDLQLMAQVKEYLVARKEFTNSFPFIWPVKGGVPDISSSYGFRYDPFRKSSDTQYHSGIDIPGELGQPIIATADGKVIGSYSGENIHKLYGNLVIIQHGYNFKTYYGHMVSVNVPWGADVKKGDVIGFMGNSGNSTGIHVHYEVRHNNIPMNPMQYLLTNY